MTQTAAGGIGWQTPHLKRMRIEQVHCGADRTALREEQVMRDGFARDGRRVRVAAALAVVALSACADGPVTSPSYQNPDSRSFAQSAMADGPMLVRIEGAPYPASADKIARVTLAAMSQAMSWTATPRLTTDPTAARVPSLVVVLTFNGPAGNGPVGNGAAGNGAARAATVSASAQCSGKSTGGGAQPQGAVQLTASFCGSGDLLANTRGSIETSTGVDDPRFAALMQQATQDLFAEPPGLRPGFGLQLGGGTSVGVGMGVGIGINR
ncbi:MAG: hypothetical protein IPK66_14185 [Rhodospirillales bacterium]|nr:hypothetical protein [Rhodospirillales bacterium]